MAETQESKQQDPPSRKSGSNIGAGLLLGITIGLGMGVAMDNIAIGFALGITLGPLLGAASSSNFVRKRIGKQQDQADE